MATTELVSTEERPATAVALPPSVTRRGISEAQWTTLSRNLFPGANPSSVLMVWDYCVARKLDPMKKPCHIVPMDVKTPNGYEKRDVVMPGIYEHRTTAQRTGQYLGHAKPEYGPVVQFGGVQAPEWCDFTVYRWNPLAGVRSEYPVRVYFAEVAATNRDGKCNARWTKAPVQMLTKCAEAAALREAFPDEIGGEQTAEEMDGQRAIDVEPVIQTRKLPTKPDGFDDWLADLETVAQDGNEAAFAQAWQASSEARRMYLAQVQPDALERLKVAASAERAEVVE